MLIPSYSPEHLSHASSLSRRVNANSQRHGHVTAFVVKLIKKGEC